MRRVPCMNLPVLLP